MRKRHSRKRQTIILIIHIIVLALLLLLFCHVIIRSIVRPVYEMVSEIAQTEAETSQNDTEQATEVSEGNENPAVSYDLEEEEIYTFLQGPKSWKSKRPWSGSWANEELADSTFGAFGCGMCCMANIYGTFSSYDCSPLDMYYYAQEVSSYSPGGGYGAIDWPEMADTLEKCGFSCSLGKKAKSYEKFQELVKNSCTAIMLVSSYNDDTYWQNTEGHYVTIWLYDEETDEVFLGDSGDPDHNRSWIPLRYVYDALKTSGSYQYLLVESYDEDANVWKHNGINDKWTVPSYYIAK